MVRGQKTKKTGSVFDFLYADHKRISLYLSQFSDFGNLTNLVHSQATSSENDFEGGVPGVAKLSSTGKENNGIERHFDTQWSQVLNFLDEVKARGMLQRTLESATLGQLVLVSGVLTIASLQPFKDTFASRAAIDSKNPNENSTNLIPGSLEHPIFMALRTEKSRLWSTLEKDYLITDSASLNLKHGLNLGGVWHILGIVDCYPDEVSKINNAVDRICGNSAQKLSENIIQLWNNYKNLVGKPDDCYGVTPLIIMREVA